jgi:hypothetical protein
MEGSEALRTRDCTVLNFDWNEVTMARNAFTPSEEQRHLVKVLSSYGIKQEDIATEVGLKSPKTLRKHFREDLDRGRVGASIQVPKALLKMAASGKKLAATIYSLNRRAGWRTKPVGETRPATIPDFVVAREKDAA